VINDAAGAQRFEPRPPGGGWRELALVGVGFAALTVALTYPLAFHPASLARVDNGDGQLSIWNVAWVARTLVVDPLHVFDANIFYPHRWTLAYSETNLGAGVLAIPVYWATGDPYAAHNFVLLLSFVLSGAATYYLVRYLVADRRAAVVAAICFAFCPYVFSHTPHIQLMMTAGIPLSLLAFHRLADRPTPGRGVALGLTMAAQALCCGYYAIFVMLLVGYAVLLMAIVRGLWANARYWTAVGTAALVAIAATLPIYVPYALNQRSTGFSRSLNNARSFSADARLYLVSGAAAHSWMLPLAGRTGDALFPGFVATTFGALGLATGWSGRSRGAEVSLLYGTIGALAFWASLGPRAGLYQALYAAVPGFSLLRAPARFGVIVIFAIAVLSGVGLAALFARRSRATLAAIGIAVVAAAELIAPLPFPRVPPFEPAYQALARLSWGPVLELPVYSPPFAYARTQYMLSSTVHWMPLVDAYSDYIPEDFASHANDLGGFPSREAFKLLEPDRVRYAVFHLDRYAPEGRGALRTRVEEFAPYLQQRYADDRTWLYEIVGFPP
jgi:hypothetical protein